MFDWFRRFTHPLGQIDPCLARSRLRPVRIRAYAPTDFDQCVELYRLNEPDRFPPGILPEFEKALGEKHSLHLVIEDDGMLVGCGGIGIQHAPSYDGVYLSFGLIHPSRHRQGLGSTLLLARLAVLPARAWQIYLQPVPKSLTFYAHFGFVLHSWVEHPPGDQCEIHHAFLSREDQVLCRTLLDRAGADIPSAGLTVPVQEIVVPPEPGGPPE